MGRQVPELPEDWDVAIPDSVWPESMISAIRRDVGALSAPRVVATLRAWQALARSDSRTQERREAQRRLEAVGRALVGEPETDDILASFDLEGMITALPPEAAAEENEDFTVDSFQLPPKPNLRRDVLHAVDAHESRPTDRPTPISKVRRAILTADPGEDDTDSKVNIRPSPTGASAPPEPAFDEDDNPTTAFLRPEDHLPEDRVPPPPPPPPPLPPEALHQAPVAPAPRADTQPPRSASHLPPVPTQGPGFSLEEDEKPTRHIALPEEILMRRLDSAEAAIAEQEPERTLMAPYPPPSGVLEAAARPEPRRVSRPVVVPVEHEDPTANGVSNSRLAPKPGVIRRRSTRGVREASAPRPRAAMQHVRTLHGLLRPFVEELVPLPYERRSRRFWARWREVAGDRGVRRPFIEELLRSANDPRTLLCELISEVQSVDVRSVYALVDKIAADTPAVAGPDSQADGPALRPLVGASIPPGEEP